MRAKRRLILISVLIATLFSAFGCANGLFSQAVDLRKVLRDEKAVALARAAGRGDIRRMERLVAEGADVNAVGEQGYTPLLHALYKKNLRGFAWLLEHGANPNVGFSPEKYSVVSFAARLEDIRFLQLALEHGGDPNWKDADSSGGYPIFHAIDQFRVENVKLLVEKGASLNVIGGMLYTPISDCIWTNQFSLALYLLDKGADPFLTTPHQPDMFQRLMTDVRWFDGLLPYKQTEYISFIEELRRRGYTVDVPFGRTREELLREKPEST